MRNSLVGIGAALGVCLLVQAAGPEKIDLGVLHRIKSEAFGTNSRVMDTAFYLTDVHGPRLTFSPAAKAAGEWAMKKMTEWGLSNVKMEPWGPPGRGWTCTHFSAEMKEPEFQPLIGFAQPWSPGTEGAVSAQAELAVITGPEDFEKYKGKLKGKIVLTAAPHPSEMITSPMSTGSPTPNWRMPPRRRTRCPATPPHCLSASSAPEHFPPPGAVDAAGGADSTRAPSATSSTSF